MKLFGITRPFSKRAKVLLGTTLAVLTALVVALPTSTQAALGANRQTKAYTQGMQGFDHVQFNSFTGVPSIGDERNFFTGMIDGAAGGFYDPMNNVKAGDTLLVRVYVHNNADDSLNASGKGVAVNTRVKVTLPTGMAQSQTASAFISTDNAQPGVIEDTLSVTANAPVNLEYVPGSARIKALGGTLDAPLGDNIVKDGVLIGSEAIDGKFNGCFDNRVSVVLKVKVTAPSYSLKKNVKKTGAADSTYGKQVTAKPGDKVDFMLAFKNQGSTNLTDVAIGDRLPVGLTLVPGTSEWLSVHTGQKWLKLPNDQWISGGLGAGDYVPTATAFLRFTAQVAAADKLECGVNSLVNHGFAKPSGQVTITDSATVNVTRTCTQPTPPQEEQPQPSYTCDLLDLTKGDNRTVNVTNFKTTATNGATFKNVVVDWGDGTETMTDSVVGKTHQYAKDGTYTIKATAHFNVNGTTKTATSVSCTRIVEFTTPVQPAASSTPVTPASGTSELPNVGAGNVLALFAVVTTISAVAHRLFLSRRLA